MASAKISRGISICRIHLRTDSLSAAELQYALYLLLKGLEEATMVTVSQRPGVLDRYTLLEGNFQRP